MKDMCGIAGIYFFNENQTDPDALRRMAKALRHRGPDQQGLYENANVALGHRRLKIIDLSQAAAQPMSDEARRYSLIFNGEIYNFRKLRKELEKRYRFFSHSDTEVILRLFQEHRDKSWPLLDGMFAIAIHDSKMRELHVARDHAGIKPLYYYSDSSKFVFASELKALLASGLVPEEMNLEAISRYLQLGYFPGESTVYRNIKKLKPGYCLRVSSDGIHKDQYWTVRAASVEIPKVRNPVEHLNELLLYSVEQQMISDVPLGAFLSGGIDSSLIVALMSRISPKPVKTFTAGFSQMGYYDERPHAKKIAERFRTEHHELVVKDRVEEIIPRLASVLDEPFADSSAIPTLCLAALAREHVTVALSGTGGDEIFGGYRKYMAAHWASIYASLPKSVRYSIQKTTKLLPASRKNLWEERALLLQRFVQLTPDAHIGLQLNTIFTLSEIDRLFGISGAEPEFDPIPGTIVENMMLFDYENYLPEDLLLKEDRCTMAFGLEARVPFLDRFVIEFVSSLPVKYKASLTSTKILFKKVAAKYLPAWVIRRPKHGFGSPVDEWLRSDLKQLATDVLFNPHSLIKDASVAHLFSEHLKRKADHSRKIWALLMLELWYQNNKG